MNTAQLFLAQQVTASTPRTGRGPSWLEGSVTVPFPVIALLVGLFILGGLVHFALRASRSNTERQLDDELR